jgi:hypothetical protein
LAVFLENKLSLFLFSVGFASVLVIFFIGLDFSVHHPKSCWTPPYPMLPGGPAAPLTKNADSPLPVLSALSLVFWHFDEKPSTGVGV